MTALLLLACLTTPESAPPFLVGGDVSEIPSVEAAGGKYLSGGKPQDPFAILKAAGWNFIRLRVWNNPKDGFCNKEYTLAMAKRVKAAGMKLSIDFHYSDTWADPGHQTKPEAWKSLSMEELEKSVQSYTRDVIQALIDQGTPPIMVQVGNEVIGGMLWPEGKLNGNDPEAWKRLARLLNAGARGVRATTQGQSIATMIHLDQGGNNATSRWWFDNAARHEIEFDLIGQSFYPWWHGTLDALRANLHDLANRYNKDIYLVEVAYPWTRDPQRGPGFAYDEKLDARFADNPAGQQAFLEEVVRIVQSVPNGRGKGVLYWAPTWISTPKEHIPWSNLALFNDRGEALPGVEALGRAGGGR